MASLFQIRSLLIWPIVSVCIGLATVWGATTGPEKPKGSPAKVKVSGYGFFGNRELKRMLQTVELGDKKPETLGAWFIEDSTVLLSGRVKRDGYLEPSIDVELELTNGARVATSARTLLDVGLPNDIQAKRAEFTIHKGVLYRFQRLEFTGLETITEKQATSYFMETETLLHPKTGRVYTPERLRRGIASLEAVLNRQGYSDATVEVVRFGQDNRTGNVNVQIRVRQGLKYVVKSVQEEVFGPRNPEPVRTRTVHLDKPYSRLWVQDFTLGLKTNEYVSGHPDVSVEMRTLNTNQVNKVVDIDILATVKTGPQVRIGEVTFEGSERTRRSVMSRRVRVKRGELLNPIRVEQGRVRLAELGVFDTVDIDYKDGTNDVRDVVYRVKEGKSLNLNLLFGWGSYELLRGGFIIEQNDIYGLGHHADLRAVQSFKSTSGDLRYTIPEAIAQDVDVFLHGSGLRRKEVDFTRLEYGGGIGAHRYFKASAVDLSVRYNYQILSALKALPEVSTVGLTNPAVGSISTEMKLDRRDNPLYPRRGYKLYTTVETATEYLGGEANYERIEVSPSVHFPLGGGRYLSLGGSHDVAVSFGSAQNNLPFNKRFFPGGSESIRGYQQDEASPRNQFGQIIGAETATLLTVQFEQALTPKWSVIAFSDSLGFAQSISDYPFDTWLFSVGGGIWWKTLIGPVRLEYGHNLNRRPGDPSGTIQFSLGFPF